MLCRHNNFVSSPLAFNSHVKIDYLGHLLMTCECHVYHSLSKCASDKILPIKFNYRATEDLVASVKCIRANIVGGLATG